MSSCRGRGLIMRMRILILILLLSCIALVTTVTVVFQAVHSNQRVGFNLKSGPSAFVVNVIRPNEPGSGGGGAGVIK